MPIPCPYVSIMTQYSPGYAPYRHKCAGPHHWFADIALVLTDSLHVLMYVNQPM